MTSLGDTTAVLGINYSSYFGDEGFIIYILGDYDCLGDPPYLGEPCSYLGDPLGDDIPYFLSEFDVIIALFLPKSTVRFNLFCSYYPIKAEALL